jgi:hypothetical protein
MPWQRTTGRWSARATIKQCLFARVQDIFSKLQLGFLINFAANLTKGGIERVVNGLPEQNLGVLASWREILIQAEPDGADYPHSAGRLTSLFRRGISR